MENRNNNDKILWYLIRFKKSAVSETNKISGCSHRFVAASAVFDEYTMRGSTEREYETIIVIQYRNGATLYTYIHICRVENGVWHQVTNWRQNQTCSQRCEQLTMFWTQEEKTVQRIARWCFLISLFPMAFADPFSSVPFSTLTIGVYRIAFHEAES